MTEAHLELSLGATWWVHGSSHVFFIDQVPTNVEPRDKIVCRCVSSAPAKTQGILGLQTGRPTLLGLADAAMWPQVCCFGPLVREIKYLYVHMELVNLNKICICFHVLRYD